MTQHTHTLAILLLAAALGASSTASAQPAGAPAPAADSAARAQALFREGIDLLRHQQWVDAEQKFLAAWALNPTADVAVNIGQTQYQLGKLHEAAGYLAFAVKHWPLTGKMAPRDNAKITLAELRPRLGTVTVQVSVPGAMVSVDGSPVGRAPLELEVFVDPGSHTVTAKLDGYDDATLAVQAEKGSSQTVTLTMVRSAPPPPSGGSQEAMPGPVPPPPPPESARRPSTAVLVSGGVVAGAALIAGAAFAATSNAKASDAAAKFDALVKANGPRACQTTNPATGCSDLAGVLNARATFADVSLWSFVGAGAVAAGTVIYALAAPKADARGGMRAVPVVTAQGAGLVMRGEW
jgi:hypothetical protein